MKRYFTVLFILLLGLIIIPVNAQDDMSIDINPDSAFVGIDQIGSNNMFLRAIDIAGLDEEFSASDEITIFVPNDVQFSLRLSQLDVTFEALLEDEEILRSILLYHIQDGLNGPSNVENRDVITTENGQIVTVIVTGGQYFLRDLSGRRIPIRAVNPTPTEAFVYPISGLLIPAIDLSAVQTTLPDVTVDTLISGVPLSGATNGMTVDADNNLWVSNVFGNQISVLDRETGEILETVTFDGGTFYPDDIAYYDGSIYWTDPVQGLIVKRDAEGNQTIVAGGFSSINPITVSEDGRLYAAQCFEAEGGIFEFDLNGTYDVEAGMYSGEEPRTIVDGQPGCASNGFDVGPDGALYGPRWFEARIVRIDVESGEITTVSGGEEDPFLIPAAVDFNSMGELHAISQGTGELVRVDMETGERTLIAQLPVGLDNMTFDSDDRLYVSSSVEGFVIEVEADGTVREISPGGLTQVWDVAVGGDMVYVAQPQGLRAYDLAGELMSEYRVTWGIFDYIPLQSVAANAEGHIITSSWFINQIQVVDPMTGEELNRLDYVLPMNAIAFGDDIIVADLAVASVVRLSGDDYIESSVLMEGLVVPVGLAATDDDLYVGDAATGMIYQIIADGEVLDEASMVAEGLVMPEGLAVMPDGEHLVVVEGLSGNVSMIDIATGEISVLAEGLAMGIPSIPAFPPQGNLNGVAVDDDGVIYVADDAENVIHRIFVNE